MVSPVKSKKVILRMSIVSVPIPHMEGSVSEQASPIAQEKGKSANEMSGYRTCISIEGAMRKFLAPTSENARCRIRMSQELSSYSNSEFVYAMQSFLLQLLCSGEKGVVELSSRNHCL